LVLLWFLGSLVILSAIGVFLVPEWPKQYLRILLNYTLFFPASSPAAAFRVWWPGIGDLLSWILSIFTILVLAVEWFSGMKKDFRWLLWAVGLTLVLSTWSGIPVLLQNLVLLTMPLILYTCSASERWKLSGDITAMISLVILFLWAWYLAIGNRGNIYQVDNLDLLFPFPLISLVGLYWVRWLFIRPKRRAIEQIRVTENA
jgi:hypothetical protein